MNGFAGFKTPKSLKRELTASSVPGRNLSKASVAHVAGRGVLIDNKDMDKFVTIVIPAYNEEKRIGATITAALQQTYNHIKVIVVDNNSTDATSMIVREYAHKDSRVQLVYESRQGLIFARQCGLDHVESELFAQLDADCIPRNTWIAHAVRYFDDTSVSAVTGPYYYYDAPWYLRYVVLGIQGLSFGILSWWAQRLKRGAVLLGGNAIIRTEALRALGGYNMNLNFYAEDSDTGARLARHGKVLYRMNLLVRTSARRFNHVGFWAVMKKYRMAFAAVLQGKQLSAEDTAEDIHPR